MSYLQHYGVKGMKWGVRRYQNPDGTRTRLGKEHYKQTVFVSGSSKTQDKESEYHRRSLPKEVKRELDKYIQNGGKILVGDAPGIDRQTQEYLNRKGYMNVEVFGPGKQVRYSANDKWKTNAIDVPGAEEYSKEWLAGKDKVMTERADHAIAVILDEGAKATRKNVDRLFEQNKDVMVYELSKEGKENDKIVDYKKGPKDEKTLRKNIGEERLDRIIDKWDYNLRDYYDDLLDYGSFPKDLNRKYKDMENSRIKSYRDPSNEKIRDEWLRNSKDFGESYKRFKLDEIVNEQPKEIREDVKEYLQNYWWDSP